MKKSIGAISVQKFRNDVHVEFNDLVVSHIEQNDWILPFVGEELYKAYKGRLTTEKKSFDLLQRSGFTIQILESDNQRDATFRGLYNTVKGVRDHFDPEMRAAANTLWPILTAYRKVTHRSFDAETADIDDFLEELKKPELAEAVQKLVLEPWIAQLGVENRRFHELMLKRYAETAQKSAYRMTVTRAETDRYYYAVISVLNTCALLGIPGAEFDTFVAGLNAIIARFKNILAQEYGRRNAPRNGEAATGGGENEPESGAEN